MKYLNPDNLPSELITAAINDPYDNGGADISVTSLIDAPRRTVMRRLYGDKVEADVSDRIWPLLGQAFHDLMDRGSPPDVITEERLFADVLGWTVSGQIDRQEEHRGRVTISDYKVTSAYQAKRAASGSKREWEWQLNCLAWLYHQTHGKPVDALEIIVLCRDWRVWESKQRDYPKKPVFRAKQVLWDKPKQDQFMRGRISMHMGAVNLYEREKIMVACSDTERWGGTKRCENYCEFRDHCSQYEDLMVEKVTNEIE